MTRTVFTARDYEYGVPGEWAIAHCQSCDFYFQAPPPDATSIPSFYPLTYSAYAEDSTTGWMFRMTYWLDARRIARLIGRRGRVLDVGCGNGAALVAMRAYGDWELRGLELDQAAAARARAAGLSVRTGDLLTADLPQASVDLIRMGHVLEHVVDPVLTLRRAYEILKPGGVLFGETPNTSCWDFRLFGRYWGALHVPRHITLFNERNLANTLREVGFVDITIAPRLRTVGWSAGLQNLLADRWNLRVPSKGRVRWYPLLIVLCLPLTAFQALLHRPATIAFTGRRPVEERTP